jgi:hypothetical protein
MKVVIKIGMKSAERSKKNLETDAKRAPSKKDKNYQYGC